MKQLLFILCLFFISCIHAEEVNIFSASHADPFATQDSESKTTVCPKATQCWLLHGQGPGVYGLYILAKTRFIDEEKHTTFTSQLRLFQDGREIMRLNLNPLKNTKHAQSMDTFNGFISKNRGEVTSEEGEAFINDKKLNFIFVHNDVSALLIAHPSGKTDLKKDQYQVTPFSDKILITNERAADFPELGFAPEGF